MKALAQIAIVALGLVLAVLPLPPSKVESLFSNGAYPFVQTGLTGFSNLVPFALLDVVGVGVIGWWTWRLVLDLRAWWQSGKGAWVGLVWRSFSRAVTATATLYVVFLLTWGLNYRRAPLVERLVMNEKQLTADTARELALRAVAELNPLYGAAHASIAEPVDQTLRAAFAQAQEALAIRRAARPARPKRTLLDPYFASAGVAGMTDPYFLETLIASDLLPIERPFVIAHEWSHLAGFADEGEANFIGWLTTVRGSALARYSGWLFLYSETAAGLPRSARTEVASRLEPGPRDDLRAISDRIRRNVRPRVASAGWRVYDSYLRANRVESGAASYREVVRLILGGRFDQQWNPTLK